MRGRLTAPDGLAAREWVEGRLGGYVRLGMPERREAVAELTSGDEPLSNVQAAAVLGVDESTIREDRKPAGNPAPAAADPPETLRSETPPAENPAPSPEELRERAEELRRAEDAAAGRFRAEEQKTMIVCAGLLTGGHESLPTLRSTSRIGVDLVAAAAVVIVSLRSMAGRRAQTRSCGLE